MLRLLSLVKKAALLVLIPCLLVRQWILSAPKRLRYYRENDPAIVNAALHIFLCAIERTLRFRSPDASALSRRVAVVFIHRFGALLTPHLHLRGVIFDGVSDADTSGEVVHHEASGRLCLSLRLCVESG